MKLSKIIVDNTLQIRNQLNKETVTEYAIAMKNGDIFPPVIVDKNTNKLVSGFHRVRAYEVAFKNPDLDIPVKTISFDSEIEMLKFGVSDNLKNGLRLLPYDKRLIISRLRDWNLPDEEIAKTLGITTGSIKKLAEHYVVVFNPDGEERQEPAKRGVPKGISVSEKVYRDISKSYSGWYPAFHAQQIIMQINNNTIATDDNTAAIMQELYSALDYFFSQRSSAVS